MRTHTHDDGSASDAYEYPKQEHAILCRVSSVIEVWAYQEPFIKTTHIASLLFDPRLRSATTTSSSSSSASTTTTILVLIHNRSCCTASIRILLICLGKDNCARHAALREPLETHHIVIIHWYRRIDKHEDREQLPSPSEVILRELEPSYAAACTCLPPPPSSSSSSSSYTHTHMYIHQSRNLRMKKVPYTYASPSSKSPIHTFVVVILVPLRIHILVNRRDRSLPCRYDSSASSSGSLSASFLVSSTRERDRLRFLSTCSPSCSCVRSYSHG